MNFKLQGVLPGVVSLFFGFFASFTTHADVSLKELSNAFSAEQMKQFSDLCLTGTEPEPCLIAGYGFDGSEPGKALQVWERACALGNASGCTLSAMALLEDAGKPSQKDRILSYLKKGCRLDDGDGCLNLGMRYISGDIIQKNIETSFSLFKKGCDLQNADSCNNLGYLYEIGAGTIKSLKKSKNAYWNGCHLENAEACLKMGEVHFFGKGEPVDKNDAADFFKRACKFGNAAGCTRAGVSYMLGYGADPDPQRGAAYFSRACELGDPVGCLRIANLLLNGKEMPVNKEGAFKYALSGCEDLSHGESCLVAGTIKAGNKSDEADALKLFDKACSLGISQVCRKP